MRKFGEFILKYKIVLIVIIVGITILLSLHLPKLKLEDDETTWFSKNDSTLVAYDQFVENFANAEFTVVAYEVENPFSPSEMEYLFHLSKELENVPYVSEVISLSTVEGILGTEESMEIKSLIERIPLSDEEIKTLKKRIELNPFLKGNLISEDNRTLGIVLSISVPENGKSKKVGSEISKEIVTSIRGILDKEHKQTGRVFYLGGGIVTDEDVSMMMERDIDKFFPLSMVLTAIVLYLIFRSLSCVICPLITVFLALVWILGLKGMINSPITPVSTTLFALIPVIGIANSVHIISHYRTELPRFNNKRKALLETYKRAGVPCLFTSLTTSVGFGSLSISHIPAIRSLGIFAGFGIMCTFILTMVIVPSALLLTKVSPKIKGYNRKSKMLEWLGQFNLKNPKWILVFSFLVILIMGMGIMKIHVEGAMLEYFKRNSQVRKDAEFLDKRLSGISNIEVVLYGASNSFKNPETLKKIDRFQELVENHPKVSASYSIIDYIKLINRALNNDKQEYFKVPKTRKAITQSLLLYEISGGAGIEDYTTLNYDVARVSVRTKQMDEETREALIEKIKEYTAQNFKQFKVDITGFDEMVHETTKNIILTQIQSLSLSLLVILGMMILLFGFRGGLISIIPNIFPVVFVLGLMGYAHFYLNIATATIAAIAIGLVVDDTIHYFSHFRYEFGVTGKRAQAMKDALHKVGKALCFTSLILILGFLIFLFSETSILVDFAILSSVAVVTALLGDLFIGPVLLTKFRVFKRIANSV